MDKKKCLIDSLITFLYVIGGLVTVGITSPIVMDQLIQTSNRLGIHLSTGYFWFYFLIFETLIFFTWPLVLGLLIKAKFF